MTQPRRRHPHSPKAGCRPAVQSIPQFLELAGHLMDLGVDVDKLDGATTFHQLRLMALRLEESKTCPPDSHGP